MILLTSLGLIILALSLSKLLFSTYFSPLIVHTGLWAIVLFLFSLNSFFGYHYVSISTEAWQLIWLSQIAFLLGCLPASLLHRKSLRITNRNFNSSLHSLKRPLAKLIVLFISIGSLGVLIKWFVLLRLFGSPHNVIANLGNLRLEYLEGQFAFPVWIDFLTFFIFPALLFMGILLPMASLNWLWVGFALGLLFLNDMSIASRGTTMHGFLLLVNAYLLSLLGNPRLKFKRLLSRRWALISVCFVIVFTALNSMRFIRERPPEIVNFITFLEDAFKGGYLYLTGPIPAFSEILKLEPTGTGFGSHSFGGLYRLGNKVFELICMNQVFPQFTSRPYVFIPQPFNSYPYLWYIYADFGILGVLFVPYTLGWISSLTFLHYRANGLLTPLIVSSLIFVYLEITPRDAATNWISFWFEGAVAFTVSIFLERRHRIHLDIALLSRDSR